MSGTGNTNGIALDTTITENANFIMLAPLTKDCRIEEILSTLESPNDLPELLDSQIDSQYEGHLEPNTEESQMILILLKVNIVQKLAG